MPPASADGKREAEEAWGDADTGSYAYIRGGVGHPERKRSFLGKAYADGCQAEGKGGAAGACAV